MALPNLYEENPDRTAEEQDAVERLRYFVQWGTAYNRQHSTRPQTLGYGLTDSPAGQAAWILEKFREWIDCDGHPENALNRDELLDNVMLYWLNASATSSARLYWETFRPVAGRIRREAGAGHRAHRRGEVPRRDRPTGARLVRAVLRRPQALDRDAPRRPLRRLRAARTLRRRRPSVLPRAALAAPPARLSESPVRE